jgi:hypothetical protein
MMASSGKERLIGALVSVASAIALVATTSMSGQAGMRNMTVIKAATIKQKPIKLRYYGGPKYPMYRG